MKTSSLEYTSFLIRLWREFPARSVEPPAADREWLAQVEHIPNGEQEYFASLEDLFAFIRAQLPGPHSSTWAPRRRSGGAGGLSAGRVDGRANDVESGGKLTCILSASY